MKSIEFEQLTLERVEDPRKLKITQILTDTLDHEAKTVYITDPSR